MLSTKKILDGLFCAAVCLASISFTNGSLISCDFETDLCGFINEADNDLDWSPNQGSATSSQTGPTGDHTTGSGKYVYIEASDGSKDHVARLVSPPFTSPTGSCLTFYYHMYGSTIGKLTVSTRDGGVENNVWEQSGQAGNMWKVAEVTLPAGSVSVVFKGDLGLRHTGDNLALDDVKVESGPCTGGSLTCDFEASMCGFTQDKSDDFEWTRNSGGTPSSQTGPSVDHTTGTSSGFYVFIEASTPRKTGDIARLVSPALKSTSGGCLTFYYHFYGETIGSLAVSTRIRATDTEIWQAPSKSENVWKKVTTTLPAGELNVVFKGVRGSSYTGDISIDDISMVSTPCQGFSNKNSAQGLFSCDFDDDLCGMTITSITGGVTWTRHTGIVKSIGTGPTNDHTHGSDLSKAGYYVYTEASGKTLGSRASISTPVISNTGRARCLVFYFHMNGINMGSLKVHSNVVTNFPLFTLSGNQGNKWFKQKVDLPGGDITVIFEGVIGNGYRSDLAIDDVSVLDESCNDATASTATVSQTTIPNGALKCDFESGLCGLTQDSSDKFDWTRNRGTTPSGNGRSTGPAVDHTTGSPSGYYMYIEASTPRVPGDNAKLVSPFVRSVRGKCLTFYYHLLGAGIGKLTVGMEEGGVETELWNVTGPSVDVWKKAEINLRRGTYKLIFNGEVGKSYVGDIAIDDILVIPSPCLVTTPLPSTVSPTTAFPITTLFPQSTAPTIPNSRVIFSCTFEKGVCGASMFELGYKRTQGSTPTLNTGPSSDHTTGGPKGFYVYMDSGAGYSGDSGTIGFSNIRDESNRCLRFFYHMYGRHVGKLNVYATKISSTGNADLVSITGNQGDLWRMFEVNIQPGFTSIFFKAVVGGSMSGTDEGDIALDDILVYRGACTSLSTVPSSLATSTFPASTTASLTTTTETYTTAPEATTQDEQTTRTTTPRTTTDTYTTTAQATTRDKQTTRTTTRDKQTTRTTTPQTTSVSTDYTTESIDVPTARNITDGVIFLCDFEENSLCRCRQGQNDDYDWTISKGHVNDAFTSRPQRDHTLGTEQGHYIFLDTSKTAYGQRADLELPSLLFADQPRCLQFYLNINAPSSEKLELLENSRTLFQLSGSQKTNWTYIAVQLSLGVNQITFRGYSPLQTFTYFGEIAIDDIKVTLGLCETTTTIPSLTSTITSASPLFTTSPEQTTQDVTSATMVEQTTSSANSVLFQCNFELPTICMCEQGKSDDYDWTWSNSQNVNTFSSRPKTDHTTGTDKGHYMYIDTLKTTKTQYADLLVPEASGSSNPRCLEFYYYMQVSTPSILQVFAGSQKLLELKGMQPGGWKLASLDLPLGKFQVLFRGTSPDFIFMDFGELAIDDVRITNGACVSDTTTSGTTGSFTSTNKVPVTSATVGTTSVNGYTTNEDTPTTEKHTNNRLTTIGHPDTTVEVATKYFTTTSDRLTTSVDVLTTEIPITTTWYDTTTMPQRVTTQRITEELTTSVQTTESETTQNMQTPTNQHPFETTTERVFTQEEMTTDAITTNSWRSTIRAKETTTESLPITTTDVETTQVTTRLDDSSTDAMASTVPNTTPSIRETVSTESPRSTAEGTTEDYYTTTNDVVTVSTREDKTTPLTEQTTSFEETTSAKPLTRASTWRHSTERSILTTVIMSSSLPSTASMLPSTISEATTTPRTSTNKIETSTQSTAMQMQTTTATANVIPKSTSRSSPSPHQFGKTTIPPTTTDIGSSGNQGEQDKNNSGDTDILPIAIGAAAGAGGLLVAIVVVIFVMKRRKPQDGEHQQLASQPSSTSIGSAGSSSEVFYNNQIYMDISDRNGDFDAKVDTPVVFENKLYEDFDGSRA